jgi:hypothetical protein
VLKFCQGQNVSITWRLQEKDSGKEIMLGNIKEPNASNMMVQT